MFFSKPKPVCINCGMETIENGKCTYCGKVQPKTFEQTPQPIKKKRKKTPKTKPVKQKHNPAWSAISLFFYLGLLTFWGNCLIMVLESFHVKSGRIPEFGHEGAALFAGAAFLLTLFTQQKTIRSFLVLNIMSSTCIILLAKIILAPVKSCNYLTQVCTTVSMTAEKSLMYSVPTVIICLFTLIYFILFVKRVYQRFH